MNPVDTGQPLSRVHGQAKTKREPKAQLTNLPVKPGETVLEVPTSCLQTLDTVPKPLVRKLPPKISVHGLLAADMLFDTLESSGAINNNNSNNGSQYAAAWNAVCPSPQDLSTAPLLWPEELQCLLPFAAWELLDKQKVKLAKDWAGVQPALPAIAPASTGSTASTGTGDGGRGGEEKEEAEDAIKARYTHAWLLVNTRTFYYINGKLKKRPRGDHMALQPVADLFNHTDDDSITCKVSFDYKGFAFRATKVYQRGDEVHICYGRHGNDKLLVEYGFAMDSNRWDEVCLDEVLLSRLDEAQKGSLEEFGFLRKYVLDQEDVCYRTQVAVRKLCCKPGEWRRFVDGADDGEASQAAVNDVLLEMLKEYRGKTEAMIGKVGDMTVGGAEQRDMLISRWKQIQRILQLHIDRLEGKTQP